MVGRSKGQLIDLGTSQLSGGQERVVAVRGVGPVHLVLLAHHANHTDIVICSDREYKKEGRINEQWHRHWSSNNQIVSRTVSIHTSLSTGIKVIIKQLWNLQTETFTILLSSKSQALHHTVRVPPFHITWQPDTSTDVHKAQQQYKTK